MNKARVAEAARGIIQIRIGLSRLRVGRDRPVDLSLSIEDSRVMAFNPK
jgi:hypothetical protein